MDSKRLVTGLIIGFATLFALISGGVWLTLWILAFVFLASKEYAEIMSHKGFLPSLKIMLTSSFLFALLAYCNRFDLIPLAFTVSSLMAFMWVLFRGKQPYIANVATTILGFVYCGWFPLHMLFLRDLGCDPIYHGIVKESGCSEGSIYTLILFFAVLVTDSFCYYVGKKFGKHKLSPVISPNKTIEGSIGGTIMCIIFSIAMGITIMPWYHALIIGLLIATFAQIGDLCESMIKREAGVKDSSNILPGHGGFLDRTDSYILTIPVIYYYCQYGIPMIDSFIESCGGLF